MIVVYNHEYSQAVLKTHFRINPNAAWLRRKSNIRLVWIYVRFTIQEKQTSVEEFTDAMRTMITFCQKQKYTPIILWLTPVDETKRWTFFQNAIIRTYDDLLQTLAKHHDVQYIPLFDRFWEQWLVDRMSDGLHPDDVGHTVVFEEVRRVLM